MTRLSIPPHISDALIFLGNLDADRYAEVRAAITTEYGDEPVTRRTLEDALRGVVGDMAAGLLDALSDAISARPDDDIGKLVAASIEANGDPIDRQGREILATRVDELLRGAPSAALLAIKRDSTVSDHALMLQKARISTDIRPVFADTGESDTVIHDEHSIGVAIIHTSPGRLRELGAGIAVYRTP